MLSFLFASCKPAPDLSFHPHSYANVWNIAEDPDTAITIFGTDPRNFSRSGYNANGNSLDAAPDQTRAFWISYYRLRDYSNSNQFSGADLFAVGKYLDNGDGLAFGAMSFELNGVPAGLWVRKFVGKSSEIHWDREVPFELPVDAVFTSVIDCENGFAAAGLKNNTTPFVVLVDDEANLASYKEFTETATRVLIREYVDHGYYLLTNSLYHLDSSVAIINEIKFTADDSLSRHTIAVSPSGSVFIAGLINGNRIGIRQYDPAGLVLNQYSYDTILHADQMIVTSESEFAIAGQVSSSDSVITVLKLNRENKIEWQSSHSLRGKTDIRDLIELSEGSFAVAANEVVDSNFTETFMMAVAPTGEIFTRRTSRIQ